MKKSFLSIDILKFFHTDTQLRSLYSHLFTITNQQIRSAAEKDET